MADAPARDEVVALVQSSPAYVAAHDKEGWVGIFGQRHVIEDPVGSRPVRSEDHGAIGRFWDAFIAPNDIVFHVHQEWVDGYDVFRDVTIDTTMSTGVTVHTPAHLLYQTAPEGDALKVRRMAAHWEPWPVYAQLMHPRSAYARSMALMTGSMLRNLGPGGTARFVGAVRTIGTRGKRAVEELVASGQVEGVKELTKVIASGNVVTANTVVDGSPAGLLVRLERKSLRVEELRVFTDHVGE